MRGDIDVTIEVDGGARVLLPGRMTSETGADRGDANRIQPGIQYVVKDGRLQFKLIAPYKPETVNLRVSVKSVAEKVQVRYVPDLREMIAVGLLESHLEATSSTPTRSCRCARTTASTTSCATSTRNSTAARPALARARPCT